MNTFIKKLDNIVLEFEKYSKDNITLGEEDLEILFHEDSYEYNDNDAKNYLFSKKEVINNILNDAFENREIFIDLSSIRKMNISENTFKIIYKFLFDNGFLMSIDSDSATTDNMSLYFNDLEYYPRLSNEEQHKCLIEHDKYLIKIKDCKRDIITFYYELISELSLKYSKNNNEYLILMRYQLNILINLIEKKEIFFDIGKMKEYLISRINTFYNNRNNFTNSNLDNIFNINNYINEKTVSKKDALNSYKNLLKLESERLEIKKYIVEHNLRLVITIAKYYKNNSNINNLSFLDLIQEGNLGLMRALDSYDINNSKFSTYAVFWIKQAITRAISCSKTIRLPIHIYEKLYRFNSFFTKYYEKNCVEPSDDIIIKELGFKKEEIKELKRYNNQIISLNDPIREEEHGVADELIDFIEDKKQNVENDAFNNLCKTEILKILSELNPKQYLIILLRFGIIVDKPEIIIEKNNIFLVTNEQIYENNLNKYLVKNNFGGIIKKINNGFNFTIIHTDGTLMTLDQIGKMFNITRERVRQIEAKTLYLLNNKRNKQLLKSYLDN